MPLTKAGLETLANFKKEYGEKRGTSTFYASINKGKLHGMEGKSRKGLDRLRD